MNIITGVNGFSAFYLVEYLKTKEPKIPILGIDIQKRSFNENIGGYFPVDEFEIFAQKVLQVDEEINFYHLAGKTGRHDLDSLVYANVQWTATFLELFSKVRKPGVFLNVGSSAIYGSNAADVLSEDLKPAPVNNYGISKSLQANLAKYYGNQKNLNIINTRTFNLIGPGLSNSFVVGKLIYEYFEVLNQKKDFIEIGRLDSSRDFIDIRDAVKYYYYLVSHKTNIKTVNIGSGQSTAIGKVCKILNNVLKIEPRIKQFDYSKKGDVDSQIADITLLSSLCPEIKCRSVGESIRDMVKHEQNKK